VAVKLRIDATGSVCTDDHGDQGDLPREGDQLTWFDLDRSQVAQIKELAEHLGVHPLALEDAIEARQRPKIDQYGDHYFLVFYAVVEAEGGSRESEVSIFVGPGYLLTVHNPDCAPLEDVARRWRSAGGNHGKNPDGMLLYAIIDSIVDGYFPVIDAIGERIEELESTIVEGHLHASRADIFAIRQSILRLRRIVAPERDVLNHLMRQDTPVFTLQEAMRFSDVYDHLMRAFDWLETYRDQMSTLLDLHTATAANNLNKTMQTLTVSSIILMTASLVAGIYGMNFDSMPELHWRWGYPLSLLLMLVLGILLILMFKRKRWL
jgi:magnesium transporter